MKRMQGPRRRLGAKMALIVICMALVLSSAALFASYRTYETNMADLYTSSAQNLVRTLVSQIDGDDLVRYYETKQTDATYEATQQFIYDLVANNDVEYLYVVRPEPASAMFLFDSDQSEVEGYEEGGYVPLGTTVELDEEFAANIDTYLAGEPIEPVVTHEAEYGWTLTVQEPILDSQGNMAGYACADIDITQIVQEQRQFLFFLGALMLAITAVFVLFFLWIIRRQVVAPIQSMTKATAEFLSSPALTTADATKCAILDVHTHDELEMLASSINKLEQDLVEYCSDLATVTAEKERIGAELSIATQIQASMLPCIFPPFPNRNEFDIYASMVPAKEVGGDFYDFFMIDDHRLAVVVADVSGKGVPAALFMVIGKTLIKDHAQTGAALGQVFTEVNDQLCEANSEGLFITAFMGVLDLRTGEFSYVNAGHNPPLLCRAGGQFEYLKVRPGFVLAGMEGIRYQTGRLDLAPGDRLFFYTDGVAEATDAHEELFGEQRLQAVLNQNRLAANETLLAAAAQAIQGFVGSAPQFDDITMLGLTFDHPMENHGQEEQKQAEDPTC